MGQHPSQAFPQQGYGYPYYYQGYGYPQSAPGYQQSPCEWCAPLHLVCLIAFHLTDAAYQQYNPSALQGIGNRPQAYQQPSMNGGYRGNIPGPASYGQQQGYYQPQQPAYSQGQQGGGQQQQDRDRSSYKNAGFSNSDF
jgi:hypothetical protein